jgi:hypothetical protein
MQRNRRDRRDMKAGLGKSELRALTENLTTQALRAGDAGATAQFLQGQLRSKGRVGRELQGLRRIVTSCLLAILYDVTIVCKANYFV